MMILRPIIIVGVFFLGLFALREPIRNIDENLALLKEQYLAPAIAFFSGNDAAHPVDNGTGNSTSTDAAPGSVAGSGETIDRPGSIKPVTLPDLTSPVKEPVVTDDGRTADDSSLSISGVLSYTNKERVSKQFPALKLNTTLNKAAEQKLQDMFTNQYFQHVSPKGVSVSDLIRKAGYEYIVVGENLALGNFGGDLQVVTAWMNSPGHRANILDPRFQEIGIAVGKGMYNGREQWIAVQHFAKPLSSCPGPDGVLKTKIDEHTQQLAAMETELNADKRNIDTYGGGNNPEYRAMVEAYNDKVAAYNTRLEALKSEIARYNEDVRKFNECAGLKS